MALDIKQNLINIGTPGSARPQSRPREDLNPQPQALPKPPKAGENYVPSNATIDTMVSNALTAKKQGTVWDRGSILNLVL